MLILTEEQVTQLGYRVMDKILQDEELANIPKGELIAVLATVIYELGARDNYIKRLQENSQETPNETES